LFFNKSEPEDNTKTNEESYNGRETYYIYIREY
jgi:hypothetical protein